MIRSSFAGLSFFVLLLSGCSSGSRQEPSLKPTDIKLETLTGTKVDLTALQGKTVFINFWATWCRPCLQEMPSIKKAKDQVGDGVVFLFASDEEVEEIASFEERRKFGFDYVRVLNLETLGFRALPVTMIFDRNGNLVFNEEGYRDWSAPENLGLITVEHHED